VKAQAAQAFQPRAADLAAAAPTARSLLINSPNNPTGVVYSQATMEGIAQVCRDHDLWLVSDEVYDTQVWEGAHLSPRALPGMAARTLVVGSMSKSHAMTGSRCGWIVGPEPIIAHLIDLATHTTYGVPGFIQDASDFALRQGAAFEDDIAAPFRRRRALAQEVLAGQNAVSLVPAQGAMYLMLDIRSTGLSGEDFAYALLERHQIAVMPGESFGKAAAGHVRVAMTIEDDAFKAALVTLCGFAEERAGG
jgi:arginine:pyruvate transaminase